MVELIESSKLTILFPFRFLDDTIKIPQLVDNSLQLRNCILIGHLDVNEETFVWGSYSAKNMLLEALNYKDNNIFRYNKYHSRARPTEQSSVCKNITEEDANNLAMFFRAIWCYKVMEYTLEGNKMETYNLIKFSSKMER